MYIALGKRLKREHIEQYEVSFPSHSKLLWPSKLVASLPNLRKMVLKPDYSTGRDRLPRFSLDQLPKTLQTLSLDLYIQFPKPPFSLRDLLPCLESLQLKNLMKIFKSGLFPLPPLLKLLQLHYLDIDAAINESDLVGLPRTLEQFEVYNVMTFESSNFVNWPNLRTLELRVFIEHLEPFVGLPSTLDTLHLAISGRFPKSSNIGWWSLFPDSIKHLTIRGDQLFDFPILLDSCLPKQLRTGSIHFSVSDEYIEDAIPSIDFYWKTLPNIEFLDVSVNRTPRHFITHPLIKNLPSTLTTAFIDHSCTLKPGDTLPKGLKSLWFCPSSQSGLALPQSLTKLNLSQKPAIQPELLDWPIECLPQTLTTLLMPQQFFLASLSFPATLRTLNMNSHSFPDTFRWSDLPLALENLMIEEPSDTAISRLSEVSRTSVFVNTSPDALSASLKTLKVNGRSLEAEKWCSNVPASEGQNLTNLREYRVILKNMSVPLVHGRLMSSLRLLSIHADEISLSVLDAIPPKLKSLELTFKGETESTDRLDHMSPSHLSLFPKSLVHLKITSPRLRGLPPKTREMQWLRAGLPTPRGLVD
jgi:hypothetical protein